MEDFLLIQIPQFQPEYHSDENYGYQNKNEKNNLIAALEKSTNGYCMYCFTRIRVDRKLYANLEHAIEKSQSQNLVECIPDIGIACLTCNQSWKRFGEKKRILPKDVIAYFEQQSECSSNKRKQCRTPCTAFRKLQEIYSSQNDAEILLQPMGMKGRDTGQDLRLQYNILTMEFEPAISQYVYSDQELHFIDIHIKRFHLNDPKYRTRELYDFVKLVIDQRGQIPVYENNNLIVELFRKKLSARTPREILKICENIYRITFLKMQGI